MALDFLSQDFFPTGGALIDDQLGHEEFADRLLSILTDMPRGAVIAVQAPWGRGKTDVLARVTKITYSSETRPKAIATHAFWLNPWKYGTPDLLSPLVMQLLGRVPQARRSTNSSLRKAAETVMCAGAHFGLKAAALTAPGVGGKILDMSAPIAKEFFKGLFDSLGMQEAKIPTPDPDPVEKMASNFNELVECVLGADAKDGRLLICIDDLDRCLPDRQVALLQAMRFLTSTGAPVSFLVGLDPILAAQAITTHYHSADFDPHRYLDKIFHFRVTLPGLSQERITPLLQSHIEGLRQAEFESLFADQSRTDLATTFWSVCHAAGAPALNPRVLDRVFARLRYFARSQPETNLQGKHALQLAFGWLLIVEVWPELRRAIQEGVPYVEAVRHYMRRSDKKAPPESRLIGALPRPDSAPGLCNLLAFLHSDKPPGETQGTILALDRSLVELGL